MKVCSVEGCPGPVRCKGYCKYHYERWRRLGEPGPARPVEPPGQKFCMGCRETKPLDAFHAHAMGKHGRESRCKDCKRLAYRADAERLNSKARNRYATDEVYRDQKRERNRTWNAANVERQKEYAAAYVRANRERYREWQRDWADRNREKERQRARERYRANPERARVIGRNGARARDARKRNQFVEHVDAVMCFNAHNGICGICKRPIDVADGYHIDHIIPLSRGGEHSYANTQPAHPGCNLRKHNRLDYTEALGAESEGKPI